MNDLSIASKDIYSCATYVPPEDSPCYSDEIFTNI